MAKKRFNATGWRPKPGLSKLFNNRIFTAFFVLAILAGLVWAFSSYVWDRVISSDIFIVRDVKSNTELSPTVRSAIVGKTVFALSTRKIYDFVRSQHPEFKSILVVKEFPSTIIIKVIKRIPVVQVKMDGFYAVDPERIVVSGPYQQLLPGLLCLEISDRPIALTRGQRIDDKRLSAAMDLAEALRKNGYLAKLPMNEINAVLPAALCFVVGSTRVIVGEADYERKLKVFEKILKEECKGDLSSLEYIDLRYQRVYLGYKR